MNRGYIKLWRKARESGLIKNHAAWAFWCWCLLSAAHSNTEVIVCGQKVELQPGQFVFGRKRWAEELGMTEKQVRSLAKISSDPRWPGARIRAIRKASKFSVYEVINWHSYQDSQSDEGQHRGQEQGQQKGQHEGQQRATYKNVENVKKKNKTFSSDSAEVRLAELLFDLIRQRNPEHKAPNLQAWARHVDLMIRIDKRSPERIEQVIRWAARDPFWSKNILSAGKLRLQFDALVIKMGGPTKSRINRGDLAAV